MAVPLQLRLTYRISTGVIEIMSRAKFRIFTSFTLSLALAGSPAFGGGNGKKESRSVVSTSSLWRAPADIAKRSLFYGPGGRQHQPGEHFTFIREDTSGSNPKFEVQDENGVKWKVKLGEESQPEVAASRFVWAVGYNADQDYLVKVLRVSGLPGRLQRGSALVQLDGSVLNARLKRVSGRKKVGTWHWRSNPFNGTREFNGLRVLMALMDNWDLKDVNNAVVEGGGQIRYEVADLGATFGTTRVLLNHSAAKGNVASFEHAKFISDLSADRVSFATPAAPPLPYVFNPLAFGKRVSLRWIGKDIPRADVRWIAGWLRQLSDAQIRDAFRAAGYDNDQIEVFADVMKQRIAELNYL